MAEGITKKLYGTEAYIQSAGVKSDLDIDGFAIAVCQELDVELSRHRSRSFDEMEDWGEDLGSFDLVVALSPASEKRARELTQHSHLQVEYWPILDPTGQGKAAKIGLRPIARRAIKSVNSLSRAGARVVIEDTPSCRTGGWFCTKYPTLGPASFVLQSDRG